MEKQKRSQGAKAEKSIKGAGRAAVDESSEDTTEMSAEANEVETDNEEDTQQAQGAGASAPMTATGVISSIGTELKRELSGRFEPTVLAEEAKQFVKQEPIYTAILALTVGFGIFKFAKTRQGKEIVSACGAAVRPVVATLASDLVRQGLQTAQTRLEASAPARQQHA